MIQGTERPPLRELRPQAAVSPYGCNINTIQNGFLIGQNDHERLEGSTSIPVDTSQEFCRKRQLELSHNHLTYMKVEDRS